MGRERQIWAEKGRDRDGGRKRAERGEEKEGDKREGERKERDILRDLHTGEGSITLSAIIKHSSRY